MNKVISSLIGKTSHGVSSVLVPKYLLLQRHSSHRNEGADGLLNNAKNVGILRLGDVREQSEPVQSHHHRAVMSFH